MERRQSKVTRFVIQALADDRESAETLSNYFANQDKQPFSRVEINQAVQELIAGGYVEAFSYSESEKKLVSVTSPSTADDSLWFGLTRKGNDLLKNESETTDG